MEYQITAKAKASSDAAFMVRAEAFPFGISSEEQDLANPAELLLGAFAACCLKNVERFSKMLRFEYEKAAIEVVGIRQDAPSKLTEIRYTIKIYSADNKLNLKLLHKNIQKHGTIYNTLKSACEVSGELIKIAPDV